MHVLELSNAEMGAFRVRLLRRGEPCGLQHQLCHEDDEPQVEFYEPADENGQPELADTRVLGSERARDFLHPREGWTAVGWQGWCYISEENSREIAAWLDDELSRPWLPPLPRLRPASQRRAARSIRLQEAGDRRVTLYVGGLFGYQKIEAEWVHVDRRPYAQYVDAIFVEFRKRRRRRASQMVLTWRPDMVILLGWDHPDLQERFVREQNFGPGLSGATITKTKYASGDKRFGEEFESALEAYLTGIPLAQMLLDLRGESVTERRKAGKGEGVLPGNPLLVPSGARTHPSDPEGAEAARHVPAVFVSYHHGNDADARELFERQNRDFIRSSSIYPGEVGPGRRAGQEIRRRVGSCDFVVVLVGRDTHGRRWVDREIRTALTRDGGGRTKPVLGVLLPETAELGALMSSYPAVAPDVPIARLLERSDAVSQELLAATGTTLPARLLDNLLSGYAALVQWPTTPTVLLEALVSATGRPRPVNRRPLLTATPLEPVTDAAASPPTRDESPALDPASDAPASDPAGVPYQRGYDYPDSLAEDPAPEAVPTAATPLPRFPEPLTPENCASWLVDALQAKGPSAVSAHLEAIGRRPLGPLVEALRRHAHLLAPLDSETSMAATLLSCIGPDTDEALKDLVPGMTPLLRGLHLVAAAPLPDLQHAGLRRVLKTRGSTDGIVKLVADPAGSWLASVSSRGVLRVWDVATGALRHTLGRPEDGGNLGRMLLAAPDGRWLASGGRNGGVDVWDPLDGTRLHTFSGAYPGIAALTAAPDGSWLAAVDSIGVLRSWSLPEGRLLLDVFTRSSVRTMAADSSGTLLAIGGYSTVQVWDIRVGERLHDLTASRLGSESLAFSADGRWLCSGGGATLRFWPMPEGAPARDAVNRARTSFKSMECLALDPHGTWVATGGNEGTIRIWPMAPGGRKSVLEGHKGDLSAGVRALAVAPDGSWLGSAGTDGTVRVWDMPTGAERHRFTGPAQDVRALVTDRSGRWLASAGGDGVVRVWDPSPKGPSARGARAHPDVPPGAVTALAADPAGAWAAHARGRGGGVTVLDLRTGETRSSPAAHEPHRDGAVAALLADPGGNWLASADLDGAVRIWDPGDSAQRHLLVSRVYKQAITLLASAPDGTWLACAGEGPRIRIWSPLTGGLLNTLAVPGKRITALASDPTGDLLASGDEEGVIRLWRPAATRPGLTVRGHKGPVRALLFTPVGRRLVSYGVDATIRFWELEDANCTVMHTPRQAEAWTPLRLAMAEDGSWLASSGGGAAIHVWDPQRGIKRFTLTGHESTPEALAVDPSGRHLVSVAADSTVRVWQPSTGKAIAALRVDAALSRVQWVRGRLVVGGERGTFSLKLSTEA
ncbi:TIR domain-containing protein [Streptomyces mirabilis]|uniref:TIR domain-containing protein n=1 Tax=Streptomyces mirabilis TaxID=68239 RepID=UPI003680588F